MIYADMHCDTLTVCADNGLSLQSNGLHTDFKRLRAGGCALQCFAVFTEGGSVEDYKRYRDFFIRAVEDCSDTVGLIKNTADTDCSVTEGKLGCILTVENLGFIGENLDFLNEIVQDGVKMASLVWNYKNSLACPNLIFKDGQPLFSERENGGLTELGRMTAEFLDGHKIIVDISHLSDGGAKELLAGRKIPLVASHSNAHGVCGVSRNLTDGLIRGIADCGGVIGLNFCADFLGGRAYESVYNHLLHIIKTGGEDVVALGSDFDGIPANPDIPDCTGMQSLFEYLIGRGIPRRVVEKFAFSNFYRVFKEVCG